MYKTKTKANMRLAKKWVQYLNEASCFVLSLVIRNSQLLLVTKR